MGKRIYDVESIEELSLTDKVPLGHGDGKAVTATVKQLSDFIKYKNAGKVYNDYASMIIDLNEANSDEYEVGHNIYVKTLEVPDTYISTINSSKSIYTYTTDDACVEALCSTAGLTIGYYTLNALETQKVNLESIITNAELQEFKDDITNLKNVDLTLSNQCAANTSLINTNSANTINYIDTTISNTTNYIDNNFVSITKEWINKTDPEKSLDPEAWYRIKFVGGTNPDGWMYYDADTNLPKWSEEYTKEEKYYWHIINNAGYYLVLNQTGKYMSCSVGDNHMYELVDSIDDAKYYNIYGDSDNNYDFYMQCEHSGYYLNHAEDGSIVGYGTDSDTDDGNNNVINFYLTAQTEDYSTVNALLLGDTILTSKTIEDLLNIENDDFNYLNDSITSIDTKLNEKIDDLITSYTALYDELFHLSSGSTAINYNGKYYNYIYSLYTTLHNSLYKSGGTPTINYDGLYGKALTSLDSKISSYSPISLKQALTDENSDHTAFAYDVAKVITDNEKVIAKSINNIITKLDNKPDIYSYSNFSFIDDETINWTSDDKAGVTRVIFNNINGNLTSASFYITDDSIACTNANAYAIVYSTFDNGNNGIRIGCSTNTINPQNNRGNVVTFNFNNITINSDFFIEFYKEQQWNETQGANYRVNFRLQCRDVASNSTLLEYLNNSYLYGCSSSGNRWLCACSLEWQNKNIVTPDEISNQEEITNKVTVLSETSTDVQYPSAKAVYQVTNAIRDEVTNIEDNLSNYAQKSWIEEDYYSYKDCNDKFVNKNDLTISYLSDLTEISKNSDGQYISGSGTIADGLAWAADVANEIMEDEKVIATALNDIDSKINDITENYAKKDDLTVSYLSSLVDVIKDEDGNYIDASDTTVKGLAWAADVAYELVKDEKITAYAINQLNDNINTKADITHTHVIDDVTDLQDKLDSKQDSLTNISALNTISEENNTTTIISNRYIELNCESATLKNATGTDKTIATTDQILTTVTEDTSRRTTSIQNNDIVLTAAGSVTLNGNKIATTNQIPTVDKYTVTSGTFENSTYNSVDSPSLASTTLTTVSSGDFGGFTIPIHLLTGQTLSFKCTGSISTAAGLLLLPDGETELSEGQTLTVIEMHGGGVTFTYTADKDCYVTHINGSGFTAETYTITTYNTGDIEINKLKKKFNELVEALKNGTTIDDTFKI